MRKFEIEAEKARRQPNNTIQTVQRLQEVEVSNDNVQAKISVAQERAEHLSTQLRLKDVETSSLKASINTLQQEFENGEDPVGAAGWLLDEMAVKVSQIERRQKASSKAAEVEKMRMQTRHDNEIHHSRQLTIDAERDCEAAVEEIGLLKIEYEAAKKKIEYEAAKNKTASLQAEIVKLQNDNEAMRQSQRTGTDIDTQCEEALFSKAGLATPESSCLQTLAKSQNTTASTDTDHPRSLTYIVQSPNLAQAAPLGVLKDAAASKRRTSIEGLSQASSVPAKKARH